MKLALAAVLTVSFCRLAQAVSCPVAAPHTVSEAEQAFLRADYARSSALYAEALGQKPNDPELTAGWVGTLLKQQKVDEAGSLVRKAIAATPKSVILQTALGLVQYREGTPWLAAQTADAGMLLDPCYAQLRLLNMYLLQLNSMRKSAAGELRAAHLLDPADPEIRRNWLRTLPLQQRIAEAEAYLAIANGEDEEDLSRLRLYLASLKKAASEPHKSCQLVSSTVSTDIKFASIMRDANHVQAYGLDVKLNDHNARLEIDTGAGGLLISRGAAKQAGLEEFAATKVGGVGSGDEKSAYTAYVDSIKIGSLEFRDCAVTVLDSRNVAGTDGLIGMDVFASLLVTLDYPMRTLGLSPLPPRPQDSDNNKPALATNESETQASSGDTPQKPSAGPQDRYVAPEMKDWTKVYRSGHLLIIPASLNQTNLKLFILDTGAFSTSISPEAAREVSKLHSNDRVIIHGLSGKVEKVYSANNLTFDFANLRQKADEVVAFDMSKVSKRNGLEMSGFIGINTLGQLTLKIDYRDGLVKFDYDPKRGFHEPIR